MSGGWANSDRNSRLPANWSTLRAWVLKRDKRKCKMLLSDNKTYCGAKATQVDHIIPNDDDSMGNLVSLCEECHAHKSSQEGNAKRRAMAAMKYRKVERHPSGLDL